MRNVIALPQHDLDFLVACGIHKANFTGPQYGYYSHNLGGVIICQIYHVPGGELTTAYSQDTGQYVKAIMRHHIGTKFVYHVED